MILVRTSIGVGFVLLVLVHAFAFRAPSPFPDDTFLTIEKGAPLKTIAADFEKRGLVRSGLWLRLLVTARRGDGGAVAGDYFFKKSASLPRIAERLAAGEFGLEETRVTIPEGLTNKEVAAIFARALPKFNAHEFLSLAAKKEGYLFPDTYHFLPNVSASFVIAAMEENFNKKIAALQSLIKSFKKPLKDVVTMASILEAEGRTMKTRRMIAGILWKRVSIGMPLQVDVALHYVKNDKNAPLSFYDLKIDSPYNMYLHKGLPPTPINNPGLGSIKDALTPISSKYFYFLVDKNGVMHYSVTHDEHIENKIQYLK